MSAWSSDVCSSDLSGVAPLPIFDHTEALEILGLDLHPLCGEVAALAAELEHRHGVLVLAGGTVLFLDLPFDGQAVAVPARHVVGVLAEHLVRPVDDVLEDLVEGVADVQVADRKSTRLNSSH